MKVNFVKNIDGLNLPKGLVGGTLSLGMSTIIVKVLGLIYKIPLSSILGDEGMGYFNSAYTVYAFFYLLCTAGVPKAVMILVSEANARGKGTDERSILKISSIMFLILGVVITTVFKLLFGILEIADVVMVAFSIGHPENAKRPIEVTLSPITTLVNLAQYPNAASPIDVTLSPITTLVRLVQPQNASAATAVTGLPS